MNLNTSLYLSNLGDTKAPFSIAIIPFLPWIAPLTQDLHLIMLLSKEASSTIFWVSGVTRAGIEPRSPEPLANTLPTTPIYIYISSREAGSFTIIR